MSVVLHRLGPGIGRSTGRRSLGRRIRRAGLATFFASVAVNAAIAIFALASPGFGSTHAKILGTSLCVTAAIVLALACEPAWERGLLGPVPYVGSVLGVLGFALAIGGIWAEPEAELYGRILGSVFAVALACTVASLLALAKLSPTHVWVARVALALLAVGATMYAVVFWLGDDPNTVYLRVMGVVLVAFAAFAVTVPVLHWIDRVAPSASGEARFCPYCGQRLETGLTTNLRCQGCGRGFRVDPIEPNLT